MSSKPVTPLVNRRKYPGGSGENEMNSKIPLPSPQPFRRSLSLRRMRTSQSFGGNEFATTLKNNTEFQSSSPVVVNKPFTSQAQHQHQHCNNHHHHNSSTTTTKTNRQKLTNSRSLSYITESLSDLNIGKGSTHQNGSTSTNIRSSGSGGVDQVDSTTNHTKRAHQQQQQHEMVSFI